MNYQTIILEKAEGIATLTLDRPEVGNALNSRMGDELLDAFEAVGSDDECRALVVTGAGNVFSSGIDIGETSVKLKNVKSEEKSMEILFDKKFLDESPVALRRLKQPTIACINGAAIGFGCTLSLACDIRIASEKAQFSMAFVRVGFIPEFGSTYSLPRVVGIAKACELAFTGKTLSAREAAEIGLVNQTVSADLLKKVTYELAQSIAAGSPAAIRFAKTGLYQALNADIRMQVQFENLALNACVRSKDVEEGLNAFLERRKPVFRGEQGWGTSMNK